MTKKTPKHLKLVVNNGVLIDEASELAKEQWQLILRKYDVQAQLNTLNKENEELGNKITELDKQIIQLERKVNGTIKGQTGGSIDSNGS